MSNGFSETKEDFLPYTPQPRQLLLHNSKCRQIIFGGAAGGGKSHAARWDLIRFATRNPGFQGYLFRESRRMLESTHIRPIKLLFGKNPDLGRYNAQRNAAEFNAFDADGHILGQSVIYMCYCENLDDAFGYLSEEMHACVIDEASRFSPDMLAVLKTRVRLGGWAPRHPKDAGRLPRFVMASNPGGPGHGYIKSLKDKAPAETEFFDTQMRDPARPEDPGWSTVFIPSKMADNKFLDSDYGAAFGMLSPEQQRAYREGDWDAVVGAALHSLRRDTHQLGIFRPPIGWLRFCAMDWGFMKPFSVGWYCVCDDDHWIKFKHSEGGPKFVPRGAVIRYAELYGWGEKENVGNCWPPVRVASEIKEIESKLDGPIAYRVADTEIWSQHGGPTVFEQFAAAGIYWGKAQKDRTRNYQEIMTRLAGDGVFTPDGRRSDRPLFFVTINCVHWWRTVPTLLVDPLEPEKGPATKNCEDHCFAGETVIFCNWTRMPMNMIPQSGHVLTSAGWRPFVKVRECMAQTWRVVLSDGTSFRVTPEHRFILRGGRKVKLDELAYAMALSPACKSLTESDSTNADAIGSERAADCTVRFGKPPTDQFLKAIMSIIRTVIRTITRSKIWNLCQRAGICLSTDVIRTIQVGFPPFMMALDVGTVQKKVSLGIQHAAERTDNFLRASPSFVSNAEEKGSPSGKIESFALKHAFSANSDVTIRAITVAERTVVHNLHVLGGPHEFALDNGVLVSNCYDETSYALRSRPWIAEPEDDDGQEELLGNVLPYQRVA